jgi:hypothetical protein
MSFTKSTWEGKEKLVIAIDCGTTQSGVAYSYLFPGGQQSVQRVLQWPGQQAQRGEAKIPTVVWYDQDGTAQAFGAEALSTRIMNQAEDDGWDLVEHFKLHLHPVTMRTEYNINVPTLPTSGGLTLERIYADFFGYLFRHTRTFFQDRELDGENLWGKLQGSIQFVIAHPNGWGAYEQDFLRRAAVAGGLVPQSEARARVAVVSEAEASVHYVMLHADTESRLRPDVNFVVCDAGGSTVDTTVYTVTQTDPVLELKEVRSSACVQAGAIFVNQTAEEFFRSQFTAGGFDEDDLKVYIQDALNSFETEGKRGFEGSDQVDVSIKVGGHKLTEKSMGIRRGVMTIPSSEVEKFFEPWVEQIIESVKKQMEGFRVDHILLVGGFGDSPYLRRRFRQTSSFQNSAITLANDSAAKAVAEGAAIWYIQHSVVARATRFSYGIHAREAFSNSNPMHRGRKVERSSGGDHVAGVWDEIVPRGEIINTNETRTRHYWEHFDSPTPNLSTYTVPMLVYTAETDEKPYFCHDDTGRMMEDFSAACVVEGDLSNMRDSLVQRTGKNGPYWKLEFDVGILFGSTELQAIMIWKDANGVEHRSPATVIPQRFT